MAMLGKRFQRTISMSQIGPSGNLHADKSPAAQHPANPPPSTADPASKLPLSCSPQTNNEQLLLHIATHQWEALKARRQVEDHHLHHFQNHPRHQAQHQPAASNAWDTRRGIASSAQQEDARAGKRQDGLSCSPNRWEIPKSAEEKIMAMMQQNGNCGRAFCRDDDVQVLGSSPRDCWGLWPQFASPSTSPSLASRSYFLDACFLCKRRLWQERDIFIYRGDKAFCSEECRHRQILCDEALSQRGSKRGGIFGSPTT